MLVAPNLSGSVAVHGQAETHDRAAGAALALLGKTKEAERGLVSLRPSLSVVSDGSLALTRGDLDQFERVTGSGCLTGNGGQTDGAKMGASRGLKRKPRVLRRENAQLHALGRSPDLQRKKPGSTPAAG